MVYSTMVLNYILLRLNRNLTRNQTVVLVHELNNIMFTWFFFYYLLEV